MKRMDTINVIPFIDIMLVLLAIVLTTATFIVEGRLDIRLPRADAAADIPPAARVELAVDRDGGLFWAGEPLAVDELPGRLAPLARDTPLVLRVDAEACFGAFVAVIDQIKARGLDRLSILTERR